ncbi:MAG: DinB family protein [Ktedonobacterales bacterium]
MPMPTPPKPGEEPTNEAELYRYHLRRLITWYVEAFDALPDEAFIWHPPFPSSNSLSVISLHAISSAEWWVLSCVGDASLDRERDNEFAALASWPELRPRFLAFLAASEALLESMSSEQLAAISRHPAGDRMNRRCLTHTIEHLGLHLGHAEITIDWWKTTM